MHGFRGTHADGLADRADLSTVARVSRETEVHDHRGNIGYRTAAAEINHFLPDDLLARVRESMVDEEAHEPSRLGRTQLQLAFAEDASRSIGVKESEPAISPEGEGRLTSRHPADIADLEHRELRVFVQGKLSDARDALFAHHAASLWEQRESSEDEDEKACQQVSQGGFLEASRITRVCAHKEGLSGPWRDCQILRYQEHTP